MPNFDSMNKFDKHNFVKSHSEGTFAVGTWVSVAGVVDLEGRQVQLAPGEIVYSQDMRLYRVSLATIEPETVVAGRINPRRIVRFSGKTVDLVKKALVDRFGKQVSFTKKTGQIDPSTNLKRSLADVRAAEMPVSEKEVQDSWNILTHQYGEIVNGKRQLQQGVEVTLEMCLKNGIRKAVFDRIAEKEMARTIEEDTAVHRERCQNSPVETVSALWNQQVNILATESEVAEDFAGDRRDFFTWPSHTNQNWQTLVDALAAQGLPSYASPTLPELVAAYKFCKASGFFHEKPAYQRHEYRERESVPTFNAESLQEVQDNLHAAAMQKVNASRLPVGFRMTWDKARQLGLTSEEFDALVNVRKTPQTGNFNDLKKTVQAGFNHDPEVTRKYR